MKMKKEKLDKFEFLNTIVYTKLLGCEGEEVSKWF